MKEANVQTLLSRYLETHRPTDSISYELKLIKGPSFAFSRLAEHQLEALEQSLYGLHYKIPDTAAISGYTSPKPFDGFFLIAKHAYVILCFYVPRKFKRCVFIPVLDYKHMVETIGKKSVRLNELDDYKFIDL